MNKHKPKSKECLVYNTLNDRVINGISSPERDHKLLLVNDKIRSEKMNATFDLRPLRLQAFPEVNKQVHNTCS